MIDLPRADGAPADARAVAIAERAWGALRASGLSPNPLSYEVFYTLFSGTNAKLTERFAAIDGSGETLTFRHVEDAHAECIAGDATADAIEIGAGEIAEAAAGIVEQVAGNGEALRLYGGALDRWRARLDAPAGAEDLLRVVAALGTETEAARTRNAALEAQLSASVERITRLRHDLEQVRQEATTDALTGIANRRSFEARLRRAIRQERAEPGTAFSLLMLDVDHFKRFNDTHGHRTGDHVLRLVARLLSDNVKGRDTAARFGGEEFAILLAGADLRSAEIVARQICERVAGHRLVKRKTGEPVGQITISIGVAQHRADESGASLIERADAALYEAKRTGRNRVVAAPGDRDAAA